MIKKISHYFDIYLEKVIGFLLFPKPYWKRWVVFLIILGTNCLSFVLIYKFRQDSLLAYDIKGKITKSGYSGSSGVGRTSGRSATFYFKVEGYDAAFYMSDILALSHIKGRMFREGNDVEIGVFKRDVRQLQVHDHKIRAIGLKVDGQEEVKIWQSLYNDIYMSYLYVSIPLAFYYIFFALMTLLDIMRYYGGHKDKKNSPNL